MNRINTATVWSEETCNTFGVMALVAPIGTSRIVILMAGNGFIALCHWRCSTSGSRLNTIEVSNGTEVLSTCCRSVLESVEVVLESLSGSRCINDMVVCIWLVYQNIVRKRINAPALLINSTTQFRARPLPGYSCTVVAPHV